VWEKYVEVGSIRIFVCLVTVGDLNGSNAEVNSFLVLRAVASWKKGKMA
jgi:hypothetical protein